jgi:hypothetical protein
MRVKSLHRARKSECDQQAEQAEYSAFDLA